MSETNFLADDSIEICALLIEEDPVFQNKVHKAFKAFAKAKLLVAKTGQQALDILRVFEKRINLVFLTHDLSDMAVVDLLKNLKDSSHHPKIVVSYSESDTSFLQDCIQAGAHDFIHCSASEQELKWRIYYNMTQRDLITQCQNQLQESSFILRKASHEIRNPISGVQGFCDLISDGTLGPVNEEQKEAILMMKKAVEQSLNLLNNLLDGAKGRPQNAHILPLFRNDFIEIFHDAIYVHKGMATAKEITLQTRIELQKFSFRIYPEDLTQLFNNLISNAIKYSHPHSTIHVELIQHKEHLLFSVQDQGIGIATSEQKHIFEPFYRATSSQPTQGESSSGLGLSIVKHIVEEYQGSISIESQPQQGTTITLRLPLNGQVAIENIPEPMPCKIT